MNCLLKTALLMVVSLAASARTGHSPQQTHPKHTAEPDKVHTYVEQMPELPGGGGTGAIVAAFQKRLRYPAVPLDEDVNGRVTIYFEVNHAGKVQQIRLVQRSHSPTLDNAVIAALQALPTFIPGYQNGRPVTVSFTLPVGCLLIR